MGRIARVVVPDRPHQGIREQTRIYPLVFFEILWDTGQTPG
jgi:hypothetical protein